MFEAIINSITGLAALTITFMIVTFPAWLAGKIVAARTRALPVPFFFRLKLLRWVAWYLCGGVALTAVALASRPTGTFETSTRFLMVGVALLAYLGAVISAFYISWTTSAQRRARKERDASDALPLAQGMAAPGVVRSDSPQTLSGAEDFEAYAPARPREDGDSTPEGDYRPARPAE